MKSPDEIKKGLECCRNLWDCKNKDCPYLGDGCYPKLHEDFKALVQQLQHNNAQLAIDKAKLAAENAEQADRIKQLEAERDAAIRDVKEYAQCGHCKHQNKNLVKCDEFDFSCDKCDAVGCACLTCDEIEHQNWEWRGVQKEE